MANGGDKGSSSSNPSPIRPNPSGGRSNAPSPSPSPLPPSRPRTLPRQWPPPVMGIPGVSSFTPYNQRARGPPPPPPPPPPPQPQPQPRPQGVPSSSPLPSQPRQQPRPHGGSSCAPPPPPPQPRQQPRPYGGSSTAPSRGSGSRPTRPGTRSSGFSGFQGAQALLFGGGGHGSAAGLSLRIGGNPATRKRGRDGGPIGGAGNQAPGPGEVGGHRPVQCSMCGKEFMSSKALFGHMRSHPGRGWKGAHPPPAFRAEEEFADLHLLYQSPEYPADAPEDGDGGGGDDGGAGGEERMEAAEGEREAEEAPSRNLPDLNETMSEEG